MATRFACPFIDPRGDDGRHRHIIVRDLNGRIVGRNEFVAEDNEIYVASYVEGDRGYVVLRGNEAIAYEQDGEFITIEEEPEEGEVVAGASADEGDGDGEEGGGGNGGAVAGAIDAGAYDSEGEEDGDEEGGVAGAIETGAAAAEGDGEEGRGGTGGAVAGEIEAGTAAAEGDRDGKEGGGGGAANAGVLGIGTRAASPVLDDIFGIGIEDEFFGDGDGDGDGGEANFLERGAEAAEKVLEEVKRIMFLYI